MVMPLRTPGLPIDRDGRRPTPGGAASASIPATNPADREAGTPTRRRRTFSAQEKLRILKAADAAAASGTPGAVGAILRREGIYASMLRDWRRQRDQGALDGLTPQQRGPKAKKPTEKDQDDEVRRLMRENEALKKRLAHAEQVIDLQKKLSQMLAIPLNTPDCDPDSEGTG